MKGIGSWSDLRDYGIVPVSSEQSGLSYRVLCKLTEHGKAIVEKCLGVELKLPQCDEKSYVGTINLAPQMLIPFGIFALLESGCTEVWLVWETLVGIEADDTEEQVSALREFHRQDLRQSFSYTERP